MSLLQFIIIISVFIFILFGIDLYKHRKLTFLHFLVFIGGGIMLVLFTINNTLLNIFGSYFGLARGADLLVYLSLIVLAYLYIKTLNDREKDIRRLVQLTRNIAIQQAQGSYQDANIVFVIPAYNESDTVLKVIQEILHSGYGIVFVDDGSTNDLYQKISTQFASQKCVAIKHSINIGQGGSLQTGFDYVLQHQDKVHYVVTFDADGQHQLGDIQVFQQAFSKDDKLDIVLGSRFLGKAINIPKIKIYTLKIGIIVTWILSGIKLTDTHNGYRMMPIQTLKKFRITLPGFEHASEFIDIIKSQKLCYTEVPITVVYSNYSMAKGQKISNAFKIVKEIIYNKFFYR